ncbi:MAG: hypothetical protein C0483_05465 [Pirellula sp.]|nr:hypothetical protein [Pirellula sp.]
MSFAAATFGFAPVLLADWISTTIWLVVISIGIINQLMGEKKKNAAKRAPPPPADGAKPAPGGKGLLDEVERFLQEARKATEQAQNRPPQQQKPVVAPQQPPKQRRTPQQQRDQQQREQQQRAAAKKKQQRASATKPLSQEEPRRDSGPLSARQIGSMPQQLSAEEETFRGSVSQHVSQHLDTSRFAERAGRLSHIQQSVDTDISGHVRSVFDHQVGTLSQSGAPRDPNEAVPSESISPLDQIALMLRDPQSMRAAFIMQEILRPPSERWS